MSSARKEAVISALVMALFASGIFTSVQHSRVGGVLILIAGILVVWRAHEMAAVQTRLSATRWRHLLGGGAPVRPRIFILWGLGVAALGIGMFIAG
jgi:hypothetical protein